VKPLGNFSPTAAPKTLGFEQGASGTSTITIVPRDGFDQSEKLVVSGLPKGVVAAIASTPTASAGILTLTVGNSVPVGEHDITITGVYSYFC
jgi:hypothetical protein